MIKKIGVENFRVFQELTEFEIRPITLLVGPNNAGKSSFTKLLLLLKNGVSELNFNKGLHNLDSFDKVLNWKNNRKKIKIRYDNKLNFLDGKFYVDAIYLPIGDAIKMYAINIANGEENLLSFYPLNDTVRTMSHYILNFNINLMMSLIYHDKYTSFSNINDNRERQVPVDNEDGNELYSEEIQIYDGDLTLENFEKIFNNISGYGFDDKRNSGIGPIVLKHEIRKLEKDFLLYDIFIKGIKATQYHKEKIIELQSSEFSKLKVIVHDTINDGLDVCLTSANEQVKINIKSYFLNEGKEEEIQIIETRLGKLLLTEKLFETSNTINSALQNKTTNYQKTLFQQFANFSKGLSEDFSSINYISANRGSQKRILGNKSENDIDQIVLEFFNKSDKNRIYLQKVFNILEIPGKLTVERFEDAISIVYLKTDDKKLALSDVGFGYSQLIPIILKITTITASNDNLESKSEEEWNKRRNDDKNYRDHFEIKQDRILIIEEPEANLHPSLQSKLADMLVATIEYYPTINFIIETHSEYLIRKLQFLTANKTIGPDKGIIYYFNADKYVTANEPKVKPIEIRENGNLSDTFGPGFYDETTRLQFDLMKLNQEQNN